MKRFGNLYPAVYDLKNIALAHENARRGKAHYGEGDKIRLDDIINRRIVVIGYRIRNSRFSKNKSGKYLALQFDLDGKRMVCFTGSDVLIEQLEKYGSEAPFEATIKKINRYYTLA